MVVVADDAGDLPGAVFPVPEHDGFGFAYVGFVVGVVEAVGGELDRAVVVEAVGLQGAGHELAGDLAADIGPDGVKELVATDLQAGLVVVELDVLGEEAAEASQLGGVGAVVVGVEDGSVQHGDGLVEVGLARELVEGLHAGAVLRADGAAARGEQQGGKEEQLGHRGLRHRVCPEIRVRGWGGSLPLYFLRKVRR